MYQKIEKYDSVTPNELQPVPAREQWPVPELKVAAPALQPAKPTTPSQPADSVPRKLTTTRSGRLITVPERYEAAGPIRNCSKSESEIVKEQSGSESEFSDSDVTDTEGAEPLASAPGPPRKGGDVVG